jgi:ABC-type nitrate/sulfonate/bicarbonate transport system substrate-binding protein
MLSHEHEGIASKEERIMSGFRTSRVWVGILLIGVLALALAACATPAQPPAPTTAPSAPTSAPPAAMQKVTFQAGYLPQGNISFIAAYVAKEKGFFGQQGLDVTIDHTAPGQGENFKRLAAKDIQFSTIPGPDILVQVGDNGVPFVAVAVFGHSSDNGLMTLANSGIKTLKDMEGKKVGYKFVILPWMKAMFDSAGVDQSKIEFVGVGFDPRVILPDFGEGRVDAVQIFKSNEPDTMSRAGFPVTVFNPEDFGVTSLGQTYVTHRDIAQSDPELVRKFLKATMMGLKYATDPANVEEVTDIIMKYAGKDANRDHQKFLYLTEIKDSYLKSPATGEVGLGYASDAEWQAMIDVISKYKGLKNAPPSVSQVWDPQYIKAIYQNGQLQFP